MQWYLTGWHQSQIALNLVELSAAYGPSAALPRKKFPGFVSLNYKYPIAISQSVTSEKHIAPFYFSVSIYQKNFLFLLFLCFC